MKYPAKKIVVTGCARNCARYLPQVLDNIALIAARFGEAAIIIAENDSTDETRKILAEWRGGAEVIDLAGLAVAQPVRTLRLAEARNICLAAVKQRFGHFDYLIVMDMDEANLWPLEDERFDAAIQFLEREQDHAAIFACSQPWYYDMWALRHPTHCPADVWEEVCDYALTRQVSDQEAFDATFKKRIFSLDENGPPLCVASAFGGFGLYKMSSVLRNPGIYDGAKQKSWPPSGEAQEMTGWQCCEHVPFHLGFHQIGGQLFIMPGLVNCRLRGMNIEPSFWRGLPFKT